MNYFGTAAWLRAKGAGLPLEEMERAIEGESHLQEIEENQRQLEQSGHWGVPTYVYENEPFFGQDRIDLLRDTWSHSTPVSDRRDTSVCRMHARNFLPHHR